MKMVLESNQGVSETNQYYTMRFSIKEDLKQKRNVFICQYTYEVTHEIIV